MVLRKRRDRRGQGIGIEAVVIAVVAAIALVFLYLIATGGLGRVLDWFDLAPGQNLGAVTIACKGYDKIPSASDYCKFRKVDIDGKKQYSNCMDPRIQRDISDELEGEIDCKNQLKESEYCQTTLKAKNTAVVNDQPCSVWMGVTGANGNTGTTGATGQTCTQQDGEWVPGTYCPSGRSIIDVTSDSVSGQVCCRKL